jgi:hypothetical protein
VISETSKRRVRTTEQHLVELHIVGQMVSPAQPVPRLRAQLAHSSEGIVEQDVLVPLNATDTLYPHTRDASGWAVVVGFARLIVVTLLSPARAAALSNAPVALRWIRSATPIDATSPRRRCGRGRCFQPGR